jgi:hypothetical protein
MKKQDEYKIGGAANEFVNKHRAELSSIKKAELEAMLKEFAIKQVNLFAIHIVSNSTELEKPTMEKYGWNNSTSFEEESGWMYEGGEDAYYEALKKWEAQQ